MLSLLLLPLFSVMLLGDRTGKNAAVMLTMLVSTNNITRTTTITITICRLPEAGGWDP